MALQPEQAAAPTDDAMAVHAWYQKLPQGWVRYTVPATMVMDKSYTATAFIPAVGSSAPAAPATTGVTTVNKSIRVATYMRVTLASTADADTFAIKAPAVDCRMISMDGDTRWDFMVTPQHAGNGKQLTFTTFVLYGNGAAACDPNNVKTIAVTTDVETVQVKLTPGAKGLGHDAAEDAVRNPGKWADFVKYVLPGGGIFVFVSGAIAWWKKRQSAAANSVKGK